MARAVAVLPDPSVDPWPVLWQSFELSMRAADSSPKTLEVYAEAGRQFHAFQMERGWPTDPAKIEKQHVENFLIWLRDVRQAKPATVRARFSALRRYFNFLEGEDEIEHTPMARIKGPKVDNEAAPEVLTDEELLQLLKACEGKEFEARRDMAIIRLMIDTGLRRQEVASIVLADVDLEGQSVAVTRKGRKRGEKKGVVYFGAKVARDLDRYLRLRTRHPRAALPGLWLAQKGQLTGDGVHHLITRRAAIARLERHIWPHLLRHSFASRLKDQGVSDEIVMTLGGWSDAKVMGMYGRSNKQVRARETHRRVSPGDRL